MTTHKWLPSEPTEEIINAIALNKNQWAKDIYKAIWEVVPEVEQEPAVYLVWHDGEFTYTKYPEEYQNTYEALPLYALPHQKREPLSEDDIWRIWDEGDNVSSALDFARAIEKAHGIGVENDTQKAKL